MRTGRPIPPLSVTEDQRSTLQNWVRRPKTAQALALRAKIVLGNVYYAAQAGNWGMAAYQLKEMPEIQEVAETTRPKRAPLLKGFEQSALVPLAKDIVNQDLAAFNADFKNALAFCNACHQATDFGYIVYTVPDKPAAPVTIKVDMKFTSDQLSAILAELLGN